MEGKSPWDMWQCPGCSYRVTGTAKKYMKLDGCPNCDDYKISEYRKVLDEQDYSRERLGEEDYEEAVEQEAQSAQDG